jgi:hypothetical protein
MNYNEEDNSFNIKIGGEGYYTKDKAYQSELSTYRRLQLLYGDKFVLPRYITLIVLATLFDLFLIITDLVLRLYSNSIKSLISVEKVIGYILISLRFVYLILLITKLILSYKFIFKMYYIYLMV